MNKKNKSLLIILLVLCIGLVGLTIAYFFNSTSIENEFSTNPYGTTITEEFISPDNWLPGTTTDKTITVTNSGLVDEAVRISLTEKWVAKDGTILSGLIDSNGNLTDEEENSEHAAIINFSDNDDWTYDSGYYYYNYKLSPNDTTSSLIDSVTFNSKTKNSSNCITNTNNGVKTITCNTTESGYDGATYTLTFTIETVQYDKYKQAWGVEVATFGMKPMTARQFILKSNPVSVTNYEDGDIHEMYTFEHDATEQTPALTDYRYIGDDPYNYVYFNCDSLDNQNSDTCEVWRIIGVFDVEDEDGNWETRYKLVRGSAFADSMPWDTNNSNSWVESSLNIYLNNDFYNSLRQSSKKMIDLSKYYLGGGNWQVSNSTDDVYNWERGISVFNPSLYNGWPCYNNVSESGECSIREISWIGKISLLYPSDNYYIYSNGIDDVCYNNPNDCYEKQYNPETQEFDLQRDYPGYPKSGWIYNSNKNEKLQIWLLNHSVLLSYPIYSIYDSGKLGEGNYSNNNNKVRPVLYLKSNVKIMDGDGSIDNPYKLGYTDEYTTYTKGQTITYDNQEYYVMNNSEGNKNYVKLLKKEPLTANEINSYNTNYTSTNGEYPYLESSTCTNGNTTNCNTNYNTSSIKTIIDNWSSNYNNDLVSINGYKSRLVNENDLANYFDFYSSDGFKLSSDTTPAWAILSGKSYWSMEVSEDSSTQVYGVSNTLSSENVYNKLYIRPVINLKKCAITNTCE